MHPKETISAFDLFLTERGLTLDAVAIGGAALGLLGVIERETRDCDILYPALPEAIRRAAVAFAVETRHQGGELDDDWLNNGPSSLADALPPGWIHRVQMIFAGTALTLRCLGRSDLLMSKVFALCDRGLDLQDCIALAPSADELAETTAWLERQDAHPNWPDHVRAVVADLQVRLGHGI
jgi:hypothetical protein